MSFDIGERGAVNMNGNNMMNPTFSVFTVTEQQSLSNHPRQGPISFFFSSASRIFFFGSTRGISRDGVLTRVCVQVTNPSRISHNIFPIPSPNNNTIGKGAWTLCSCSTSDEGLY